jgi:hypothetical protein
MAVRSPGSELAKVVVSSTARNIGAFFVSDPARWGESGELFINVGNGAYEIPTDLFIHPQAWRDIIEPSDAEYSDNETYFSHVFTEDAEEWNVTFFWNGDKGDGGYRDVVRFKFKYDGNDPSQLFKFLYKIYTLTVFSYEDSGSATEIVKAFERPKLDGSAGSEAYLEHCIEQELELEPLTT